MTPPAQDAPPTPRAPAQAPALLGYVHQLLATTAAAWGLAMRATDEHQPAAA